MADIDSDENKEETREMVQGGLLHGRSSTGLQPTLRAQQSPPGAMLLPLWCITSTG